MGIENHFAGVNIRYSGLSYSEIMDMKLDRRSFVALLAAGAARAAAAPRLRRAPSRPAVVEPGPLCFFIDRPPQPPARPRTAAITYLHS